MTSDDEPRGRVEIYPPGHSDPLEEPTSMDRFAGWLDTRAGAVVLFSISAALAALMIVYFVLAMLRLAGIR